MNDDADLIRELLDWEDASLHPGVAGGWILAVRGQAPKPLERVALEPTPIGIAPSEYRGLELIGYHKEPSADVLDPFEISEEVDKFSGTRGITLIGKTMRENFDLRSEAS